MKQFRITKPLSITGPSNSLHRPCSAQTKIQARCASEWFLVMLGTTRPRFGLVLLALVFATIPNSASAQENFEQLFNGKDLTGWAGIDGFWSVKDGAIVGQTTKDNPTKGNTFLVWQGGDVSDFVFKAKVKFSGNNSGVQYRSELIDAEKFVVKGYQADLHKKPEYFGMLFAEKWRGIVAQRFQRVEVGADGKPKVTGKVGDRNQKLVDSEWNELTIIAVGDRQIHQVNGITTIDLTDNHPEARRKGILALQLHAGAPMNVEFKDVQLRHLSGDDAAATIKAATSNTKKTKNKVGAKGMSESSAIGWVSKAPVPKWIWRKDQPTADAPLFLRKSFHVPGKKQSLSVKSAKLYFTCDNEAKVWLNGDVVGSNPDWMEPVVVKDAAKFIQMGKNQIAVEAVNKGGAAAFLFKLVVETSDGKKKQITSNKSWKLSDSDAKKWTRSTFDDSAWSSEVSNLGDFGIEPWGKPGSGPAKPKPFASSDEVSVADGFKVELIYEVPKATQGSWVSLTCDDEGRFYASDQGDAGLFRFTVSESVAAGKNAPPVVKVEKMPADVSGAHGMVWYKDALYFNRGASPMYRLTDSTGDGLLDRAVELTKANGGGEHGNHALIVTEDGEQLYFDAGNHTDLPDKSQISGSRVPSWDEDLLLPREWNASGHARGRMAPGGWITRFDTETKKHEVYSIGYRNQYDITLNRAGDLFTYDADMEWDLGSPWYRPTRINHAVSGSDYGWRSGTGKWPAYYEDSLPAVLNIGPGSPTGVVSGLGAKFPAKYQDAIFALDWTFGTIYAIHLKPDGAGWRGDQEIFCNGAPLPVTDAVVGKDGALYFATGGRGTDSAVYRITYVGGESTEPVASEISGDKARSLRRRLEAFHGKENPEAVKIAWKHLNSEDRWLRHAARIAIESQPVSQWADRAFKEANGQAAITSAVAIARSGDVSLRNKQIFKLLQHDPSKLSDAKLLGLLRAYALTFIRLGEPSATQRELVIAELDAHFPHANKNVNTELVRLLVYLKAPNVVEKTLPMLANAKATRPFWAEQIDFTSNPRYGNRVQAVLDNQPPSHEINYAFMLRNVREGWTMEQRRDYITFINKSAKYKGGVSYGKFLTDLRNEFLGYMTNDERMQLADISDEDFNPVPQFKITPPKGPGKKWTQTEATKLVGRNDLATADFKSGRNLFHSLKCATCHRFSGLGGDVGPDLTTAQNKFDANYLLESIIEPSKVISDQYSSKIVLLEDGRQLTGLVIRKEDKVEIYPVQKTVQDLEPIIVNADEIEEMKDSSVSQMPAAMLDALNEEEVRDLIAYLLSGGRPKAKVYQKR